MKNRTIIFASSNQKLIEKFEQPLGRIGYSVAVCRDGEIALEKVREIKASAIIADLTLPKINSIDLCWLIREKDNQIWLPFLMLSEIDDNELRLNCFRSGVDAFLIIPVTFRELIIRLEVLIKRFQKMLKFEKTASNVFIGDLREFLLSELIQLFHNHNKTGRLWISRQYQRGSIYFNDGNIKSARLNDYTGEDAIYKMLNWKKGRFEFESGKFSVTSNVKKTTLNILLEHSKQADEMVIEREKNLQNRSKKPEFY